MLHLRDDRGNLIGFSADILIIMLILILYNVLRLKKDFYYLERLWFNSSPLNALCFCCWQGKLLDL
jgi:hypothetical protein